MKVLVTTHAQMFQAPDGSVWTGSVYGYDFFKRYFSVFSQIRLVTRMKQISFDDTKGKIRVDGNGIEFYPMPFYHGPWQYAAQIFKIRKHLLKAISGCDCAVLRIPDQLSFQIFKKIKKAGIPCGVEVVAHPWDLYAPGTFKTVLRPFLRILWDHLQKRTCREADGIAYVTEKYIQKRYPSKIRENERRFETSYTSADLDEGYYFRQRGIEDFNHETIRLVHVSGINNTAKGHAELLQTIHILNEKGVSVFMQFVGGGTRLQYYKDMSAELGISDQVVFWGYIAAKDEIIQILKDSDIFVFPTMTEGLPRVILEAMATGLPCIATNVGGIPELLSDRCLVKPNNVQSLTEKIDVFICDKNILVQESEKNFKRAKQYSSQSVQQKREIFYKQLYSCVD